MTKIKDEGKGDGRKGDKDYEDWLNRQERPNQEVEIVGLISDSEFE